MNVLAQEYEEEQLHPVKKEFMEQQSTEAAPEVENLEGNPE
jgi:hypothetical protein